MTGATAPTPSSSAAEHLDDLADFLSASPSPFHAVHEVARRLVEHGYRRLEETSTWSDPTGRCFVIRDGALLAWSTDGADPAAGFRIVGAHTDSPNLRVRPRPDHSSVGMGQLGVEVYGSPLLNSWLDRDLGLSGRVALRGAEGRLELRTFRVDEPLLRIPQLAIHLDRSIMSEGLRLDPQRHMIPVWSTGTDIRFVEWLADRLEVDARDVLAWDAMTHDLTPPARLGADESMFAGPRLDDLLSCHAATVALTSLRTPGPHVPVIALFDHEEVGSGTASGAQSELLSTVLERVTAAAGIGVDGHRTALARSACISADGAHATHPNWPERHEPDHGVRLDGGPVVKTNAMARYATDARGAALVLDLADTLGLPTQQFVSRNDMPCGSTIGPVTASTLGVTTVDVGVAQLSMHSARELCGVLDPHRFALLLEAFLGRSSDVA